MIWHRRCTDGQISPTADSAKGNGTDRYFTVCGVARVDRRGHSAECCRRLHRIWSCRAVCVYRVANRTHGSSGLCSAFADRYCFGQLSDRKVPDRSTAGARRACTEYVSGAVQTVQQLAEMGIGLFAAVGTVTLFVALIGVMGSMLAAAHEKTGEIGILLALGAQPHDIRRTFLPQAVLLCLFGGIVILAAAGALLHFEQHRPCRKAVCLPDC